MTRRYLAADRSVAVDLEPRAVETMLDLSGRAGDLETGGVLVGRYSEYGDRVIVTQATGPPRDSRQTPAGFVRGIAGLTRRLQREWRDAAYYVGEWHSHPMASATPSTVDVTQIMAFAADADLQCPRPILAVLGGDPRAAWVLAVGVVMDLALLPLQDRSEQMRRESLAARGREQAQWAVRTRCGSTGGARMQGTDLPSR